MSALLRRHALLAGGSTDAGGDPYWDYVNFLFNFDGSDGSAEMTEEKFGRVLNRSHDDVRLSAAQKKIGTTSCSFPDGRRLYGSSSGYSLGTGDFCIEFFFYLNGPINTYRGLVMFGLWSSNINRTIVQVSDAGALRFYVSDGPELFCDSEPGVIHAETWYHAAAVRKGDDWMLFLDGTLQNTVNVGSKSNGTTNDRINIGGSRYSGGALWYTDGYIDGFRVTKGAARYESNFTPPVAPLPNHG